MANVDVSISCLGCGDRSRVSVPEEDRARPLERNVFSCSECGARMTFGQLAPRIVNEPFVDELGRQWIRKRFQHPITKKDLFTVDLDPEHAGMDAKDVRILADACSHA